MQINNFSADYFKRLVTAFESASLDGLQVLAESLKQAWQNKSTVYLCGNGGSAANAIHIANDFIYGAGLTAGVGLRVEALSSNPAVLTCLGNDLGFDSIYSEQLRVKANNKDLLIVLSGSGNSKNIINALEVGSRMGLKTFAILGFSGGQCKDLAQFPIHFEVGDMQIAEDLQLIVGHICMQWLTANLNASFEGVANV
jgi:D-sedoheptulose 7-phosphate isomerase